MWEETKMGFVPIIYSRVTYFLVGALLLLRLIKEEDYGVVYRISQEKTRDFIGL